MVSSGHRRVLNLYLSPDSAQVNLSPIHISTGERAKVQADLRAASCCSSSNSIHDPPTKESERRYSSYVYSPALSVATAVAGTVMKRAAPIRATDGGGLAKQAVTARFECESDASSSPSNIQEEAQVCITTQAKCVCVRTPSHASCLPFLLSESGSCWDRYRLA